MKPNLQNVTEPVTDDCYNCNQDQATRKKNANRTKQEIFDKWQTIPKGWDAKPAG